MSRTKMSRDLGKLGPTEPRMLIDQMTSEAKTRSCLDVVAPLATIRLILVRAFELARRDSR